MSDTQCAPRMIDLRLAPAAAATWAATWWATGHPVPWGGVFGASLAALACTASYARSRRGRRAPRHALTPPRSARLGLALLLACVACALAVGSAARRQYDADPARRDSGPIHARVVLQADPAPPSSGFSETRSARARIEAVSVGEEWHPSNAAALVRAPGWKDAARGDVYEVWGSLDATFAADAPSVGTIRVRRAQLIERPGGLSAWMRSTHRAFAHACAPLPRDARSLVPGMAIGDDRGMPSDLSDAMKKTSLTHLTAISGSHIVIILATVTLIVPARKTLRLGATILVLGTILTLVGPDPSVVRSVCVAAVASLGLILGREGQSIAALCAVVIATLLIDPAPTDSPCRRSPRSRSSAPPRRWCAAVAEKYAVTRARGRRFAASWRWCTCQPLRSWRPRRSSCHCPGTYPCGESQPTSLPSPPFRSPPSPGSWVLSSPR